MLIVMRPTRGLGGTTWTAAGAPHDRASPPPPPPPPSPPPPPPSPPPSVRGCAIPSRRSTGASRRAISHARRRMRNGTVDASAYDENASSSVDAAAALARTSRVASVCRTLRPSRPISIAPDPGSAPRRRRPRILPRAATTLVRSLESLETPLLVVALHPLLDVKTQRTAQQGETHQVQLRPTAAHGTGGTRAGACDVRA